jgi:hypothetical protein
VLECHLTFFWKFCFAFGFIIAPPPYSGFNVNIIIMIAAAISSQPRIVPGTARIHRANGLNVTSKSPFVPSRPKRVTSKALPDASFIFDIAEGAPGSVDAPLPVVAGLAVVISAAALLFFSLGLKPGK